MNVLTVPSRFDARLTASYAAVGLATLALAARGDTFAGNLVLPLIAVAGLLVRVETTRARPAIWAAVTAGGLLLFAAGRELGSPFGERLDMTGIVIVVTAGIAEEALFRRGMYGLVAARRGDVAAVVVAALAFGFIHIPTYGWESLPLNVAAGLVFGWQRWASRSWTAPAATHALANLFQAGWV